MPARRHIVTLLVGVGMFVAVYLVDLWLVARGLHAESTWIDNILLSIVAAAMAWLLQRHQERELRRQQQSAAVIEQMNHHIRNALQVIVARASLDQRDSPELEQITDAVARIDWALREILPQSSGEPPAPFRRSGKTSDPLPR
ncbi:MAG TPA: hypothetical protein VHZ09_09100 [Acidobacteriaceae bacterium]|jgi:mannitol-1-phosphate/altronate dehydrogenase|nr:hypothetical protein [Acidobacteriaceae bacterium]